MRGGYHTLRPFKGEEAFGRVEGTILFQRGGGIWMRGGVHTLIESSKVCVD